MSCLSSDEPPERAPSLRRVPDTSVARGGDVVRTASRRHGILADGECGRRARPPAALPAMPATRRTDRDGLPPRMEPVCPAGLDHGVDECRVGATMPATARIALSREARAFGRLAAERPPAETARLWADVLGKVPLFAEVSARQVRKIARLGSVARFVPNEPIVTAGNRGDAFYVILSGRAKVLRGSGRTMAESVQAPTSARCRLSTVRRGRRRSSRRRRPPA